MSYPPNQQAQAFGSQVAQVVEADGMRFRFSMLRE